MKRFVVGYVNFFDNDLILEIVEAETEHEARWKHNMLRGDEWDHSKLDTANMDNEEFKQWCFNCDILASVIEIPKEESRCDACGRTNCRNHACLDENLLPPECRPL